MGDVGSGGGVGAAGAVGAGGGVGADWAKIKLFSNRGEATNPAVSRMISRRWYKLIRVTGLFK